MAVLEGGEEERDDIRSFILSASAGSRPDRSDLGHIPNRCAFCRLLKELRSPRLNLVDI